MAERIRINFEGVYVRIKITDPSLIELYRNNPERVEEYFRGHLFEACADVKSGEGLDNRIKQINLSAVTEKKTLLEKSQRN